MYWDNRVYLSLLKHLDPSKDKEQGKATAILQ